MSKGGVCSSGRPREVYVSVRYPREVYVVQDGRERCKLASDIQEVYVVPDGQERCLWLQMTAMGVCGVGCPREVYVVDTSPTYL
jgi:hypothetical protein